MATQNDPCESGTFLSLLLFAAAGFCFFGMRDAVPGTEHVGQIAAAILWVLGFISLVFTKTGLLRTGVVQWAQSQRRRPFNASPFELGVLVIGIAIGFACKANGYVDLTETHRAVAHQELQAKASSATR